MFWKGPVKHHKAGKSKRSRHSPAGIEAKWTFNSTLHLSQSVTAGGLAQGATTVVAVLIRPASRFSVITHPALLQISPLWDK